MKANELIPLEDWVLKIHNDIDEKYRDKPVPYSSHARRVALYKAYSLAKLLKSTPTLGDFIPCDEDGRLLSNPKESDEYQWDVIHEQLKNEGYREGSEEEVCKIIEEGKKRHLKAYQEAEQRVLWEGEWKVIDEGGKYYIIHGEDYLVWDKSDRTFDVKVDMIFFRGKDKWTYADLINDEGLENKGLIFKRDL